MSVQGDPYRTLGLTPGASVNEIRAAYRRLAKQYHPDAAGERALARFLAIQAAYERLVDSEGRLRRAGTGRGTASARRPAEPWRADPSRARASRDAWRARRAGAAGGVADDWARGDGRGSPPADGPDAAPPGAGGAAPPGAGGAAPPGAPGSARPGAGNAGQAGQGDAREPGPEKSSRRRSTSEERGRRRGPRRATPGSTTYDEASEGSRDPAWDGGAWYGPSLGTYWTINPREYADPRKHGPEYQARASRARDRARSSARTSGSEGDRPTPGSPASGPEPGSFPGSASAPRAHAGQQTAARPGSADRREDPRARDHGSEDGTWTYAADGDASWASRRASHDAGGRSAGPTHATWTSPSQATATSAPFERPEATAAGEPIVPDLESLARRLGPRSLLDLARRGWRWRWLLAVVGWPPIGLALGTLLTSATGCAEFAVSCPEPIPTLAWLLQPLIPLVLVVAPPVAALAAFGTIAALAASVPLAAVLAVGTGPGGHAGAPVLGVLVATVYLVAIAGGAIALWRPAAEP